MGMRELGEFLFCQGWASADVTGCRYQNSVGSANKVVRLIKELEQKSGVRAKLWEELQSLGTRDPVSR